MCSQVIPLKFGEKYFDSKQHSNIDIILKDESKIHANSIVLAANSPYFEGLIEKNNLESIEMDEYDADAVKMFIKSLYVGEFGIMNNAIFRQMSKLSFTFQVSWMKDVCLNFFQGLVNCVPEGGTIESDKFLLEEATAAKVYDTTGQYLDMLALKKTSKMNNQDIAKVEEMLSDLNNLPLDQLDFFIRLANNCNRVPVSCNNQYYVHHNPYRINKEYATVIVEKFTEHLSTVDEMDSKIRYVLQNLDFSGIVSKFNKGWGTPDDFKMAASKLFQSLLELKEISNEDMKLTLRHFMSLGA